MPANTWMTEVFWAVNEFKDRPLSAITLPGTHDAGCYVVQAGLGGGESLNSLESRTQAMDIGQQLAGGIRYFDIRPYYDGDAFHAWHGAYTGGAITGNGGILEQINNFFAGLPDRSKELAILNVSHFSRFDDGAHAALINRIRADLQNYLIPHTQANLDLYNTAFRDLVAGGPRVAVLYDGAMDQGQAAYVTNNDLPAGFFKIQKYQPNNPVTIFDEYSNMAWVEGHYTIRGWKVGVLADQLAKLNAQSQVGGTPGHLHVFSWTCTPQPLGYPIDRARDDANPALLPALRDGNNWGGNAYNPTVNPKINVIYVDHFASETLQSHQSPRDGYAMPVAIADLLNRYSEGTWGGGWHVL